MVHARQVARSQMGLLAAPLTLPAISIGCYRSPALFRCVAGLTNTATWSPALRSLIPFAMRLPACWTWRETVQNGAA